MKMFTIFGISFLAALACLTAIATFDVTPSAAAGSDNWTMPYNHYWGDSSAGQRNNFVSCSARWGNSACYLNENVTEVKSFGGCASAWGDSRCIAPGR